MSEKLSVLIEQFKLLLENGEEITPSAARKMQLALSIDTHTEVKRINGRLKKVEAVAEEVKKHPSLLWLLRFRTKRTVATIVFLFTILSVLYMSEIRELVLGFLGLPSLLP